jgi:hypothetical protein
MMSRDMSRDLVHFRVVRGRFAWRPKNGLKIRVSAVRFCPWPLSKTTTYGTVRIATHRDASPREHADEGRDHDEEEHDQHAAIHDHVVVEEHRRRDQRNVRHGDDPTQHPVIRDTLTPTARKTGRTTGSEYLLAPFAIRCHAHRSTSRLNASSASVQKRSK